MARLDLRVAPSPARARRACTRSSLHGLVAGLTLGRGDREGYLAAVERDGGGEARLHAERALAGLEPPLWEAQPDRFPLIREALDFAEGVVVHSAYAEGKVRAAGYAGPVHRVAYPAPSGEGQSDAPLPAGRSPVIGSLGKVNSAKRIPQLLHAYSRLLRRFPNALLVLAGEGVEDRAMKIRLDALGLEAGKEVLLRGYVPAEEFSALAAESDICVSLRSPTLGETSASAIAALAAGDAARRQRRRLVQRASRLGRSQGRSRRVGGRPPGRGPRAACFRRGAAAEDGLGRQVVRAARARCRAVGRWLRRRPGGARRLTSSDNVAARSSLARTRTWIAAVPAWLWLGALILASAGIRLALAKPHPAPWVFPDELIYSNLAESFAETRALRASRVARAPGLRPGYPLLIAPAYSSSTTSPTRTRPRRRSTPLSCRWRRSPSISSRGASCPVSLALVAATLALAIPSFLYTGTILTENAFYPAFAAAAFGMFAALERPTPWRQLGALALIGVAFVIRAQAVGLGAAFLTAIVLVCLVEASGRRPPEPS